MLEEAVIKISRKNCILFTGAGFSHGLQNFLDEDIPQVSSLTNRFLDIAKITEDRSDYDLESASGSAFLGNHDAAMNYIQKAFRCKSSDEDRQIIASKPWRRVYTANYDDAFEISVHHGKIPYTVLDVNDVPSIPLKESIQIVHIHGAISCLTSESFRKSFYLTDEQSRDIAFDRSAWRRTFLEDLTYCDAAFFVGFSNSDFHIRRLLDSVRHLAGKIFFITSAKFSSPARQRIMAYGSYAPIGISSFAAILRDIKSIDLIDAAIPQCFIERSYPKDFEGLNTRDDVLLELLLGTIDPLNFGRSGLGGYYFDRVNPRGLGRLVDTKGAYVFFADVGNGKTTIIHQIASECFRRGRKVFQHTGRKTDTEETRRFVEENTSAVYLIENVSLNYEVVKIIQDASKAALILSTDRSKRLELASADLRERMILLNKVEVNKLNAMEVNLLIDYLDHNILWGDALVRQTREAQILHIQTRCAQELRGVLFSLFEGGSVHSRISLIFDEFATLSNDVHDLIILNCVINYAYTKSPLDRHLYNLEDFLDIRLDYEAVRREVNEKEISEFISVESGLVGFKSSIFAKYYLNKMVDIDYTLDLIFRVMKNLELSYRGLDEDIYFDFSKAFMQYNLYREIYSRNSARDAKLSVDRQKFDKAVEKFYDRCRVLKISVKNPLFIVQISMASMDRGEFDACEDLIASARSIAGRGFDHYQIDTHQAEVLVKKSIKEGLSEDMQRERRAYQMLKSVVERRNERYHPFGVFDVMINLFEAVWINSNDNFRGEMILMLRGMKKLAMRFPDEIKDKYHIVMRVHQRSERMIGR